MRLATYFAEYLPGLLLSGKTGEAPAEPLPAGGYEWEPKKSPEGAVSIIFSMPDSEALVFRNGVQIGRCTYLTLKKLDIKGSHIYSALDQVAPDGTRKWLAVNSIGGGDAPDIKELSALVIIPKGFLNDVRSIIAPGTTLILTDLPVSAETRSQEDFRIMTAESVK